MGLLIQTLRRGSADQAKPSLIGMALPIPIQYLNETQEDHRRSTHHVPSQTAIATWHSNTMIWSNGPSLSQSSTKFSIIPGNLQEHNRGVRKGWVAM